MRIANHLLRFVVLPAGAGLSLPGQAPVPPAVAAAAGPGLTQIHWDETRDEGLLALAPGYKARFAAGGAVTFVPYLGARAPGSFPVTLTLASIHRGEAPLPLADAPTLTRVGDRVDFAHGAGVTETWAARAAEVEQTFTFTRLAGAGDLVVTLAVATSLACTDTAEGLTFAIPGLGAVVYGDVLAFDAAGREVRTASRWRDGRIELRIPAAFLAAVRGPLTIDPVLRTVNVAVGGDDQRHPAVAFDARSDRWLVAFTRVFSLTDGDILARRFTRDGTFLDEVGVAVGFADADNAAVGATSPPVGGSSFLVAWDEGRVANRAVLGRRRSPFSTTQGNTFTIRTAIGLSCARPAVGGATVDASTPDSDVFAVVWEQDDGVVGFARVRGNDTVGSFGALTAAPAVATAPAITRGRRDNEAWIVSYLVAAGTGHEVHARVLPAGIVTIPAARMVMAAARHGRPSVAGTNQDAVVVAARATLLGAGNVFGVHLRSIAGNLSVLAEYDLTAREPGTSRTADQRDPVLGFDGCRFAYAYREQVGTSADYDAWVATFLLGSAGPIFHEGHQALVTGARMEEAIAFVCAGETAGPAGDAFAVVEQAVAAGDHDLLGVTYRAASPLAGVRSVRTRCFFEPNIAADRLPVLGATVRVTSPVAVGSLPVTVLGFEATPSPLCGLCALGVGPIVHSVASGTLVLPVPCDPHLVGASVAVQNFGVNHPNGCDPFRIPLALIASDTLVLTIG